MKKNQGVLSALRRGLSYCRGGGDAEVVPSSAEENSPPAGGFALTLLHAAVALGYTDVVQALAARGHTECFSSDLDESPLQIATHLLHDWDHRNLSLIDTLVQQGADIGKLKQKSSLLTKAICYRNWERVRHLMDAGAKIDQKTFVEGTRSLLHIVVVQDCPPCLRERIVGEWEDIDYCHSHGETALYLCVRLGKHDV